VNPDPALTGYGASDDYPETINAFNGSAQADHVRNQTFHGFHIPTRVGDNKLFTASGGGSNTTTNSTFTFYRGYAFCNRRNPRGNDGLSLDFVNWVQPDMFATGIDSGFDTESDAGATAVDIRGCSIFDNSASLGDIYDNGSGTAFYYGTSGLTPTTDHSVALNTPTLVWTGSNPFSSSRVGPYTGRPTAVAMDGTLRTAILAEVAGTHAITLEAPGGTIDPISGGQSSWLSFNTTIGNGGFFATKMLPYEKRYRDSIFRPWFYRWNPSARVKVKEWTANWPGLNPHVERGMDHVIHRPLFGGV